MCAVLDEMIEWSTKIKQWQSDALRRLVESGELTSEDNEELLLILKKEFAIPLAAGVIAPNAVGLDKKHSPKQEADDNEIILESMGNFENVNAISPNQKIEFSHKGVTTIYGGNASGKSGYARVLKKACRGRGKKSDILTNIYDEAAENLTGKAEFKISGIDEAIKWDVTQEPPDELAMIAVFDSDAERYIIDERNEVQYIPYGLDVFTKLGNLYDEMKQKLNAELKNEEIENEELSNIDEKTKAGNFFHSLSSKTKIKDLEENATITSSQKAKFEKLMKTISKWDKDTSDESRKLDNENKGIKVLLEALAKIERVLIKKNVDGLKNHLDNVKKLKSDSEKIRKQILSDTILPGTGSETWQKMYEAAKQYSVKEAYKDIDFPFTDEESVCVLCQQPILGTAVDRFKHFKEYVESELQKEIEAESAKYDNIYNKFKSAEIDTDKLESTTINRIGERDKELETDINKYIELVKSFISEISDFHSTGVWEKPPSIPLLPMKKISDLTSKIQEEISSLSKPKEDKKETEMRNEFAELKALKVLSDNKEELSGHILALKHNQLIGNAIKSTNTNPITRMHGTLTQKYVTDELTEVLKAELDAIGVDNRLLFLDRDSKKGATTHKLKLASKWYKKHISRVLSEGEMKSAAIASFLAEIEHFGHTSGIIFDDPVNSLDHEWTSSVAERLVKEGSKRQVIIFTHDIVFLDALRFESMTQNIDMKISYITTKNNEKGIIDDDGKPWVKTATKKQLNFIESRLQEAKTLKENGEKENSNSVLRDCISLLRTCCESIIEIDLLGGVVTRYSPNVETKRLNAVSIDDEDIKTIYIEMTLDSEPLHSSPKMKDKALPTFEKVQERIASLRSYIKKLHDRSDETQKRRKKFTKLPE